MKYKKYYENEQTPNWYAIPIMWYDSEGNICLSQINLLKASLGKEV